MNLFFIKRKKLVLDSFTCRPDVYEFAKVDQAQKFIPHWFKHLDPLYQPSDSFVKQSTIKQCVGVNSYFQTGFIMPLWSDLAVRVGKAGNTDYDWQFSDLQSEAVVHSIKERGDYLPPTQFSHLKLRSPWLFQSSRDIKWLATGPDWHLTDPSAVYTPGGVVDFKHQHATNINLFFKRTAAQEVHILKHGTPIMHFVPLTEESITLKCHLIDANEYRKLLAKHVPITFTNKFSVIKGLMHKNSVNQRSCPFGNH